MKAPILITLTFALGLTLSSLTPLPQAFAAPSSIDSDYGEPPIGSGQDGGHSDTDKSKKKKKKK